MRLVPWGCNSKGLSRRDVPCAMLRAVARTHAAGSAVLVLHGTVTTAAVFVLAGPLAGRTRVRTKSVACPISPGTGSRNKERGANLPTGPCVKHTAPSGGRQESDELVAL